MVGALGGVLITGCVGLATAVLTHRWQHESVLDERAYQRREGLASLQREAYARYLAAIEAFYNSLLRLPRDERQAGWSSILNRNPAGVDELYAAANHARLLASDPVVEALDAFTETWQRDLGAVKDQKERLIQAMRAEQTHLLGS